MGSDSVIDKAIELGTTYFKSGSYEKAKDLFKKAIKLGYSYNKDDLVELRESMGLSGGSLHNSDKIYHPKLVKLYDNLSATYEKLQELDKAYESSSRMIHIEPYNMKGYIRMGKVLQRQGKDPEAYKCYKKGLLMSREMLQKFDIVVPEKFRDIIKQQRDIVKKRINNQSLPNSDTSQKRQLIDPVEERKQLSKRLKLKSSSESDLTVIEIEDKEDSDYITVDFISELPSEVIPFIFSTFSTKEIIKFTEVSKSWNLKILSNPEIFQKLFLTSGTSSKISKFLRFICKLKSFHPTKKNSFHFDLLRFSSQTASEEVKSLTALLQNKNPITCTSLILTIPNSTTGQLYNQLSKNSQLCHNLKELSLVISHRMDKKYEEEIVILCKNLKRVEFIVANSVVPVSRPLDLNMTSLMVDGVCDNLQTLKLICDQNKVTTFPLFSLFYNAIPKNMVKLCITGVTLEDTPNQFSWLTSFDSLQEIWFENNKNSKLLCFLDVFNSIQFSGNLKKLTFRDCTMSEMTHITNVRENYYSNFRNIVDLDLMGTSISGAGLLDIISTIEIGSLKRLNIGNCPYIRFGRDSLLTNPSILSVPHCSLLLSGLEELKLPNMGSFDDNSFQLLIDNLIYLEKLSRCDFSFNPVLTGVSLYEFVKTLKSFREVPLEQLKINGCPSISHITVGSLKLQNLVENIECVYEMESWTKFGINSYKYKS
ncbi:hypothetical protein Kpol_1043p60 [Vanderwaltozyma polyspora DSM 70294]|uniref:F-box domain-containing protein n=1 Tax=Vanderwaltozyma polyspora (strain ATCC 22028 / DSM 70294 / BCRC 21397 / CBS 2163 / NBRC 10782 / NRRL Y-8283 / UCD 57-17) TaxID=436907 RepID=A7TIS8_VANPO|nr:uncharacterized protein Kpol_1043p60 [Vanderwaltozyma polyspora DSM 70294]EDO17870.1 hypothetical protein Kpol_1043p60 [Vanderwaltozyma polyspora DSM 70294]